MEALYQTTQINAGLLLLLVIVAIVSVFTNLVFWMISRNAQRDYIERITKSEESQEQWFKIASDRAGKMWDIMHENKVKQLEIDSLKQQIKDMNAMLSSI